MSPATPGIGSGEYWRASVETSSRRFSGLGFRGLGFREWYTCLSWLLLETRVKRCQESNTVLQWVSQQPSLRLAMETGSRTQFYQEPEFRRTSTVSSPRQRSALAAEEVFVSAKGNTCFTLVDSVARRLTRVGLKPLAGALQPQCS